MLFLHMQSFPISDISLIIKPPFNSICVLKMHASSNIPRMRKILFAGMRTGIAVIDMMLGCFILF